MSGAKFIWRESGYHGTAVSHTPAWHQISIGLWEPKSLDYWLPDGSRETLQQFQANPYGGIMFHHAKLMKPLSTHLRKALRFSSSSGRVGHIEVCQGHNSLKYTTKCHLDIYRRWMYTTCSRLNRLRLSQNMSLNFCYRFEPATLTSQCSKNNQERWIPVQQPH